MRNNKKGYGTMALMILAVIIIFSVVGIVIIGFKVIKKNEDTRLLSASDTEYIDRRKKHGEEYNEEKENQEKEAGKAEESDSQTEEEKKTEEKISSDSTSESDAKEDGNSATESESDSDADSEMEVSDSDTEVSGSAEKVYLIKGNEKSSNRYEKADHLSYTTVTKYTAQDLSLLDSYGLKITRNEIFARHGRMFNDQELQEYFQRQQWYVPQVAANDFDVSCLNEVEKYNVELISTYEQQVGGR